MKFKFDWRWSVISFSLLSALILLLLGKEGWGWFIFLAVILS